MTEQQADRLILETAATRALMVQLLNCQIQLLGVYNKTASNDIYKNTIAIAKEYEEAKRGLS